MFRSFAIRDLTILAVTIGLWIVDGRNEGSSWMGMAAGIGAAVCAYNLHEWGHLIGAHLTSSVFTPAKRILSPFLFSYDSERNSRRQFLIMSLSGFAATAVFVAAFLLWMPQDRIAGRWALNGALILAGLTVIIEFPIFFRALLGRTLPRVAVFPERKSDELS